MGGMIEITKAFTNLSLELGVEHINNIEIKKLIIDKSKIVEKKVKW